MADLKIQNGRLKKPSFSSSPNSQYFFMKISGIGPWVSRIGWWEGHWFGSTYMAVRLSDIRSKTAKKCLFCVFRPLLRMTFFWVGHFEFFFQKKNYFFCFIPMKISPNLYGRMDGSKFWCFPWFPENSLLCVILRYTV